MLVDSLLQPHLLFQFFDLQQQAAPLIFGEIGLQQPFVQSGEDHLFPVVIAGIARLIFIFAHIRSISAGRSRCRKKLIWPFHGRMYDAQYVDYAVFFSERQYKRQVV